MIALRPHHFLCIYCFRGEGYSNTFTDNLAQIHNTLESQPLTQVIATSITDAICMPCPHRVGTQCSSENKIQQLDQKHQTFFNWSNDIPTSWNLAKQHIKKSITVPEHQHICHGCEWLALGICANMIEQRRSNAPNQSV